ncbi:MAG: hypothetical protein A2W93_00415 [Bacteroidetes bacterium GWF2_43_63]|nr:MAG: hypothetical protein A2W94_13105 [Bacteroidetes bacterium GWE2_42_42]OFY53868.1 MAG: hypothetical protein A2W93_00415 [Bacteroidetes bacterium GWF2_43_63]HBG69827.1 hypothetical protein [Bacteroidales bacterium]HCB60976.1 hypothetical protein [Bacteroidales bacterium]HCY24532.1 hypothetical protein [Bacteroidales bacterium]
MENEKLFQDSNPNYARFGWYVSIITTILTVITFGIAMATPPLSGPFCTGSCFEYPFTDIASRFPRDYYWMFPAIILSISYLIMMITIYHTIPGNKKLFGLMSVVFAIMASLILIVDYFIQVSVIQPSILSGEYDGISLLTQFNPHGIFIVLEEIGFLFMIISFFVLFPVFSGASSLEKGIKWIVIIGLLLAIVSFTLVLIMHGIQREYRFEIIIISITWLELILFSFLLSRFFKTKYSAADNKKP